MNFADAKQSSLSLSPGKRLDFLAALDDPTAFKDPPLFFLIGGCILATSDGDVMLDTVHKSTSY